MDIYPAGRYQQTGCVNLIATGAGVVTDCSDHTRIDRYAGAACWRASAIGIVVGGGSLFAVAWVYQFMTGREGMGGGDIKLLAMIGGLIGLEGVLLPFTDQL